MTKLFSFAAILMAILTSVSLAQQEDQTGESRQTQSQRDQMQDQQRMGQARDAMSQGQKPDQMFLKEAASGNQLEIQLGQLATERAQDPQIKQFAQQLVEEHQQAAPQLQQAAQSMNMELPRQLNPVHQAVLEHMRQKQGDDFGRAYIFHQVGDHHKKVLEHQYQAQNAQNPQIKQLAARMVPTLREHLQHAERIAGAGDARPAADRMPATPDAREQDQGSSNQIRGRSGAEQDISGQNRGGSTNDRGNDAAR